MEVKQKRALLWTIAGLAAIGAVLVGWAVLGPEPSQERSEAAPVGATTLAAGSWRDGETFHKASGRVTLMRDAEGYVLHFEGYDATPGPDVHFYLTREAGASTTQAVEGDGVLVRTDTPKGQATLRGDFNVRIPAGVDPTGYGGIVAWCTQYNAFFGWAPLEPVA